MIVLKLETIYSSIYFIISSTSFPLHIQFLKFSISPSILYNAKTYTSSYISKECIFSNTLILIITFLKNGIILNRFLVVLIISKSSELLRK